MSDLVVLNPHENFNVLSLSGKREGRRRGEGSGFQFIVIFSW